ncbi:MAG: O-antigen ligase family protein [Acidobacteriota bacterium]
METLSGRRPGFLPPCLLGLWCGAVAAAQASHVASWQIGAVWIGLPAAAALAWWSVWRPQRWLGIFFLCALLTPPFPGPIGDAGFHAAPAPALIGVFAGLLWLPRWRLSLSPLAVAFGAFLLVLLASVAMAAWYSGASVASGSLLRVGLFGIGVYVFLYASSGPWEDSVAPLAAARWLFLLAIAAALFACADFYFQWPAPAGFEAQYVWLDEGVFRRAQGLFYEASTLGNFCAFFLVMVGVAMLRPTEAPLCPRWLLAGGGGVLSAALIFSYSRASVLNVVTALVTLALLRRVRIRRSILAGALAMIATGAAVRLLLPSFAASYWARLANSIGYFWYSPDGVLSGRLGNWSTLLGFLIREPWHALFGIGYKTLPYSDFTGAPVIADNTYLSLLVETGIVGLASFLLLNAMILRYGLRAARSRREPTSFFGEWIFCFWVGQMVQMFSGDLITYWRVLPVYFWVLGMAVRE